MEQIGTELVFQPSDLPAHRRLRHVELLGRTTHVAALRDGDEVFDLGEAHVGRLPEIQTILDAQRPRLYSIVVQFDFLGTFRCCQCGHEFRAEPGSDRDWICPKRACRSMYAEWLDYDRFQNSSEAPAKRNSF